MLRFVNPAFETLTGFRENEVCGKEAPFPWWPKEDSQKLYNVLKESLNKGGKHHAMKFINKLGRCFYVNVETSRVNGNDQAVSTWFDVTDEVEQRQQIYNMLKNATQQIAMIN